MSLWTDDRRCINLSPVSTASLATEISHGQKRPESCWASHLKRSPSQLVTCKNHLAFLFSLLDLHRVSHFYLLLPFFPSLYHIFYFLTTFLLLNECVPHVFCMYLKVYASVSVVIIQIHDTSTKVSTEYLTCFVFTLFLSAATSTCQVSARVDTNEIHFYVSQPHKVIKVCVFVAHFCVYVE